jgi:hypothetical protein
MTYRHGLEFYGTREWRISITPLTEKGTMKMVVVGDWWWQVLIHFLSLHNFFFLSVFFSFLSTTVMRATLLAHRDSTSVSLTSSCSPGSSSLPMQELMSTTARNIGMPFHCFHLSGSGGGSDKLLRTIRTTVATGHWVHVEDGHLLTEGLRAILTATMVGT